MDFGGTGTGTSKIKNITRRLFVINVATLIVFAGILGRLAQLQMAQGTKYSYLSDKNRFREWKIIPPRGVIEDYFGKKLADNSQVFQLHLIPEDIEDENVELELCVLFIFFIDFFILFISSEIFGKEKS